MARYATSESMYQCCNTVCRIWFSDREGIKEKVALGSDAEIKTHIGCPKCDQDNRAYALQLRHVNGDLLFE